MPACAARCSAQLGQATVCSSPGRGRLSRLGCRDLALSDQPGPREQHRNCPGEKQGVSPEPRPVWKKALGPGRGPSGRTSRGHPTPVLRTGGSTGSLAARPGLTPAPGGGTASPVLRASSKAGLEATCRSRWLVRSAWAQSAALSEPGLGPLLREPQHHRILRAEPASCRADAEWAEGLRERRLRAARGRKHAPALGAQPSGRGPPAAGTGRHAQQSSPAPPGAPSCSHSTSRAACHLEAGVALLEASQDVERDGPFEGLLRSPVPAASGPLLGPQPSALAGAGGPSQRHPACRLCAQLHYVTWDPGSTRLVTG